MIANTKFSTINLLELNAHFQEQGIQQFEKFQSQILQDKCDFELIMKEQINKIQDKSQRQRNSLENLNNYEMARVSERKLSFLKNCFNEFAQYVDELISMINQLLEINKTNAINLQQFFEKFQIIFAKERQLYLETRLFQNQLYEQRSVLLKEIQNNRFMILSSNNQDSTQQLQRFLQNYYENELNKNAKILMIQPNEVSPFDNNVMKNEQFLVGITYNKLFELINLQAKALEKYNFIILQLDEAITTEKVLILLYFKELLQKNAIKTLIITISNYAQLHQNQLIRYFAQFQPNIINNFDYKYPIEINYCTDQTQDLTQQIKEIQDLIVKKINTDYFKGDILIFLANLQQVYTLQAALSVIINKNEQKIITVVHELQQISESKLEKNKEKTKIILTFSRKAFQHHLSHFKISHVVDTGVTLQQSFNYKYFCQVSTLETISKQEAQLRANLAVITNPGKVWRLYNQKQYLAFKPYNTLEFQENSIELSNLRALQLFNNTLTELKIPFGEIDPEKQTKSLHYLTLIKALSFKEDKYILSKFGTILLSYPFDIQTSLSLSKAQELNIYNDFCLMQSYFLVSCQNPFTLILNEESNLHQFNEFCQGDVWSDHWVIYKIMNKFKEVSTQNNKEQKKWADLQKLSLPLLQLANKYIQYLDLFFEKFLNQSRKNSEALELLPLPIFSKSKSSRSQFNKLQEDIIKCILSTNFYNICFYSNQRRVGFNHSYAMNCLHYHSETILKSLQEYPKFLIATNLVKYNNEYQIRSCAKCDEAQLFNIIPEECSLNIKNHLTNISSIEWKTLSLPEIATLLFVKLNSHNNFQICKSFEDQFQAIIELNTVDEQITMSSKQNQLEIEQEFQNFIFSIEKLLTNRTKVIIYNKATKIVLADGGKIAKLITIDTSLLLQLKNLPLQVTDLEIRKSLANYINSGDIEKIKIQKQIKNQEEKKFAVVTLISVEVFNEFFENYEQNPEFIIQGNQIIVKEISQKKLNSLLTEQNIEQKIEAYSVKIQWFHVKHQGEAKISLLVSENTKKSEVFEQIQKLFPQNYQFQEIKNNNAKLLEVKLSKFGQELDEIQIQKLLLNFTILNLEIQNEQPKKVNFSYYNTILYLFDTLLGQKVQSIDQIQKKQNGRCTTKVHYNSIEEVQKAVYELDSQKNKLGEQSLYVRPIFNYLYNLTEKQLLVLQILLKEQQEIQEFLKNKIVKLKVNNNNQINLACSDIKIFEEIKRIFEKLLSGQSYPQKDEPDLFQFLSSEIGSKRISYYQQQYPLVITIKNDMINYIGAPAIVEFIRGLLLDESKQNIKTKMAINIKKIHGILGVNGLGLQEIRQKYQLVQLSLDLAGQCLILLGKPNDINQAQIQILELMNQFEEDDSEGNQESTCELCLTPYINPYRLLKCHHKFCKSCLVCQIEAGINDVTLFPFKCPMAKCNTLIALSDIDYLLPENQWDKVMRNSLKQFFQENQETYRFCFTVDCTGIIANNIDKPHCKICNTTFCRLCETAYHNGLTCSEFKDGTNRLFAQYMKENGVRKCPKCGAFVVRVDGCYRVECLNCHIHMCFKCPEDKMVFYPDYGPCYKHLDDVHGGYW